MTFRKWFKFGKTMYHSDVKQFFIILVLLSTILEKPLTCRGEYNDRESRTLFGGYRITPTHCKATRAAKYNKGNTTSICMFNHECAHKGGEVVGTCMDGFLIGACCQVEWSDDIYISNDVTTTTPVATSTTDLDEATTENYKDQSIDYNDTNLCGVRSLVKSGRIVGGKNARFGEWPWQVLVRENTWLGLFFKNKCGGVLITNRFVITAAYCKPGFLATLQAVFGENHVSNDKELKQPVSRNVQRVIVHQEYNADTFENNLALLELKTPIQFDVHIVPICMPFDDVEYELTGRMATVTGWGRLKYQGSVPAVLQEVEVPVIENSACEEMFNKAGHPKKILDSFICAGYAAGRKDACEGDTGGPLVVRRDDGRWQLIGTVSHGVYCAAPLLPGVYMRTTYYKPWLMNITGLSKEIDYDDVENTLSKN